MLAASNLDIDILPSLYECLVSIGHSKKLDVVLYGRGGIVNASRRISILLHKFCDQLTFLVPHYCESAATLLALSGHNIEAGPVAIFSPIDPQLQSAQAGEEVPHLISSQDVRLFGTMIKQWFKVNDDEIQSMSASILANSIFPTTLTSFYRSDLELQQIATQLLALNLGTTSTKQASDIATQLISEFHSHSYAITQEELAELGINIIDNQQPMLWSIAKIIQTNLGAGKRSAVDTDWYDVIIASEVAEYTRCCNIEALSPQWQVKHTECQHG